MASLDLTPKQERFCQSYIETGNASEAYRQAYSAKGMTDNSISVEASRLLDNPKITLRLDELQKGHQKRHEVTVDSLILELENAREVAMQNGQASAMVTATMGKAKLHGFLREKHEFTSKDGGPIDTAAVREKIQSDLQAIFGKVAADINSRSDRH